MQFQHTDLSELDELTEESLGFAALSDGLGFHPQKRAPRSKEPVDRANAPMGASVAGPATVSPQILKKSVSLQQPYKMKPAPAAAKAQTSKTEAPTKSTSPLAQRAANPGIRFVAFAMDLLFVTMPLYMACKLVFTRPQLLFVLHSDWKSMAVMYAAIVMGYFLLSESFGGQSLAKILFGLRIVEDDKYEKPIGFWLACARIPTLLVGTLAFGAGLFSSFADTKLRPWHDKITGTIVRVKN